MVRASRTARPPQPLPWLTCSRWWSLEPVNDARCNHIEVAVAHVHDFVFCPEPEAAKDGKLDPDAIGQILVAVGFPGYEVATTPGRFGFIECIAQLTEHREL